MQLSGNKILMLAVVGFVVGALYATTRDTPLDGAIRALAGGGLTAATAESAEGICGMTPGERALHRENVNAALESKGICRVTTCPDDPPAACPRDTVLAETGKPAESSLEEEIESAEDEAEVREQVKAAVEAEIAAEAAAEAAKSTE